MDKLAFAKVLASKTMFSRTVRIAERMSVLRSGQGRGYPLSIWYGRDDHPHASLIVVDYENGEPDRVQDVGSPVAYHRPDLEEIMESDGFLFHYQRHSSAPVSH